MERTDRSSIVIPAERERIYAALLDPSALETWLPPDNMRGRRYPDVPWRDLARVRDVYTHAYHRVDYDLMWEQLVTQLPDLRRTLGRIDPDDRPPPRVGSTPPHVDCRARPGRAAKRCQERPGARH